MRQPLPENQRKSMHLFCSRLPLQATRHQKQAIGQIVNYVWHTISRYAIDKIGQSNANALLFHPYLKYLEHTMLCLL